MRHYWHPFKSRLRHIFFGAPYEPADPSALSPRGSQRDVRLMLIVVGTLWLSLVLFDNLARFWQRQPKSWRYFQGARELNEAPNQTRHPDFTHQRGDLIEPLSVGSLARQYSIGNDTTRTYLETDAAGFRTVRYPGPVQLALCGDSFSNNNSFADSLAQATGLGVLNRAIEGRGTLTMARWLEAPPVASQPVHLVVWESTQRTNLAGYEHIALFRRELRQTAQRPFVWRESLLWPANLDIYLTGSSLLSPLMSRVKNEVKWNTRRKTNDYIILGRRDLHAGTASMLYMIDDEGLRQETTTQVQFDSIADCVAIVARDLRKRGQELIFVVAPEKSVIYPDRLPNGLVPRTNFISDLNRAIHQRGVRVVDIETGLYKAAHAHPQQLYYYTADTHWTPRGMALASRIVADSLLAWHLLPANRTGPPERTSPAN